MTPPSPTSGVPAHGRPVASKTKSTAWWLWSLGVHALLLGVLYLVFPYKAFVKPDARPKVAQPLVNQRVLETTTKRIEEKQAEQMARKLRELAVLTADIQATEVSHQTAYASFKTAIIQLSPELANDLAATARQLYQDYQDKLAADQAAWDAYATRDAGVENDLATQTGGELRATYNQLKSLVITISGPQDKLNFAQAGLLDTQQQIAGRLGFLKEQEPDLIARQAAIVAAWNRTLALGSEYSATHGPLRDLYDGASRIVDGVNNRTRDLQRTQGDYHKVNDRLAKRATTIAETQQALAALATQLAALDPADKKLLPGLKRKSNELQKKLERDRGEQAKDQATLVKLQTSLESRTADLDTSRAQLAERVIAIHAARKALLAGRGPYLDAMRQTLALQQSLDSVLTETLARIPVPPPSTPATAPVKAPEVTP